MFSNNELSFLAFLLSLSVGVVEEEHLCKVGILKSDVDLFEAQSIYRG
jgi:hypothetical protein